MNRPFLTGTRWTRDHRRTAIWMTLAIAAMGARPVHAQEEPPASLMARALRAHGLESPLRANAAAAQWLPRLRVHALIERTLSSRGYDETIVWGELAWPLGRRPVDDAIATEELRRQTERGRERLVEHLGDVWRRRQHARDERDDVDGELRRRESQAELDALTGDSERGP